jgi:chromosome segregation ATPase
MSFGYFLYLRDDIIRQFARSSTNLFMVKTKSGREKSMEEFMTRVSEFVNERRNHSERGGSLLTFCMLGVVVLVIIILCLLLLWQKKTEQSNAEKTIMEEAGLEGMNFDEEMDLESEMMVETFEVKQEEIMASPEDEELKQQYLTTIQYLEDKVSELLESMTIIKETLESVQTTQEEDTEGLQTQINEITADITQLVTRLQETQTQLYDLKDIVNVMRAETIPQIQEQMAAVSVQIANVNTDITNLYNKIAALETADKELRTKINEVEGSLKATMEQNMIDISDKIQNMAMQIGDVQAQIQKLTAQGQYYRYDASSNTLYLFPKE